MKFDESKLRLSMAGIVRDQITDIDLWLGRGARLSEIYEQCLQQGMVGSFNGFKKELQRARKRIKVMGSAPIGSVLPAAASSTPLPLVPAAADVAVKARPAVPTTKPIAAKDAQDDKIDVEQFFKRKSIFDR